MSTADFRDCDISGATPAALSAFERALAAFQSWRSGSSTLLMPALKEAPAFVMAHVLQIYLNLSSRDPALVRTAQPIVERLEGLPANGRERLHLGAIRAVLADEYEQAKAMLGSLLFEYPRDVLALQIVHALDYVTGDLNRLRDRVAGVLPAWSADLPGYHAVLAMHAFSLEESADYQRAVDAAHQALALNPFDARAHHALAHVFEMTERPADGLDWMYRNVAYWTDTVVATHCWWHMALFHLAKGQVARATALYDERVRPARSLAISDMIDATALLWRIGLHGHDAGARWGELASAWAPHIADGFCTFSDLHAMMAFVGAKDWRLTRELESELIHRSGNATRHGETTRQVGLAASRGLIAFGRGDYSTAVRMLGSLPALAHRIGGSLAQRDVLHLTLLRAIEYVRRPRLRHAVLAAGLESTA